MYDWLTGSTPDISIDTTFKGANNTLTDQLQGHGFTASDSVALNDAFLASGSNDFNVWSQGKGLETAVGTEGALSGLWDSTKSGLGDMGAKDWAGVAQIGLGAVSDWKNYGLMKDQLALQEKSFTENLAMAKDQLYGTDANGEYYTDTKADRVSNSLGSAMGNSFSSANPSGSVTVDMRNSGQVNATGQNTGLGMPTQQYADAQNQVQKNDSVENRAQYARDKKKVK